MTRICGIYKITSPSGKIYVGQSVSIKDRWNAHKERYSKYISKLGSSFKKYGVENHLFEIIEECDILLLNEREKFWVEELNTFNSPHGLNLRTGGDKYIMSDEIKQKLRVFNLGKKHSDETKKKCSIASKGRIPSAETREKLSISNKGKKRSTECRMNISLLNKQGKIGMLGKKHSETTKEKMRSRIVGTETKEKIRAAMVGKKYSIERVNKSNEAQRRMYKEGLLTAWNKGLSPSQETKDKIRKGTLMSIERIKQERLMMIF